MGCRGVFQSVLLLFTSWFLDDLFGAPSGFFSAIQRRKHAAAFRASLNAEGNYTGVTTRTAVWLQ